MKPKNILLLGPTSSDKSKSMKIYALNLYENLKKINTSDNINLMVPETTNLPFFKDIIFKELIYPLNINQNETDIFHITDHSYGSLAYSLPPSKTVITCHDLNALELKQQSSKLGRTRFSFNVEALKYCKNIITNSEYTKNTIIKHFKINTPITVVPLGLNKEIYKGNDVFSHVSKKKYCPQRDRKYLLHVGHSNAVKNIESILETLVNLPSKYIFIKVGEFTSNQETFILEHKLSSRINQYMNLDSNELRKIYHAADILVFPSFIEGFGLPIIEAMACGLPVITSNTTAMPETGGNAAYYIDPYKNDSLLGAIMELTSNHELRKNNIKLGYIQAAKFFWKECAIKTQIVYESIK